jgi:hypothetical protein
MGKSTGNGNGVCKSLGAKSQIKPHWLDQNLNGKWPGVASDGNFSSYLVRRSGYGWLFPFPVGGNGNNTIYPLLSAVLSTWTEPETCFG